MKLKGQLIDEKTLYSGKIFDVKQAKVELPDGRLGIYDIVKSPDACAVVALDDNNNVIMVKQYRPSAEKIMLEIPAGKIDEGEDPAKCALRELSEETGYRAQEIEKLFSIHVSPGFCTEIIHIFKAAKLTLGDTDFDDDEYIQMVKIPLEKTYDMIKNGEIEDAKTISGLLAMK